MTGNTGSARTANPLSNAARIPAHAFVPVWFVMEFDLCTATPPAQRTDTCPLFDREAEPPAAAKLINPDSAVRHRDANAAEPQPKQRS
jgi:hypothetical protein